MKIYHNFFKISLAFVLWVITADISRARSDNMSDHTAPNTIEIQPEPTEIITDPNNPSPDNQPPTTDPGTDNVNTPTNPEDPQTPEAQTPEESQPDPTASDPNNQENDPNDPNQQETGDTDTQENDPNDPNQQEENETADSTDAEETGETDPESEKEEVGEKEDETETQEETTAQQEVNRSAFEAQIQGASTEVAIQLHEELQVTQLISSSGVQLYGEIPSVGEISERLGQLWQQTGNKPAFINVSLQSSQLEAFAVLPTVADTAESNNSVVNLNKNNSKVKQNKNNQDLSQSGLIRTTVDSSSRKEILTIAKKFRKEVSNARHIGRNRKYLESAQQLYQLILEPLEAELEANDVDILVFSMDSGLRLIPIAALHDGEQFLIEKYAVALVPSFGLTDTRYVDVRQSRILAMGASLFENEAPLPTMPLELRYITSNPRQGEVFLNDQFTVNNFITQNRRSDPFRIIHLGTHAQFVAGDFADSFIQFSDRQLKLPELRRISDELGWSTEDATPIELLVLSACETALGDEESELGFAGLAVQAGVKSALASLWYISDLGTLALMSEFYDNLSETLIKAKALQKTQLSMLRGEVRVKDRELILSNGDSVPLPSTYPQGSLTLSDPYFWSAFTLIGNWN